jgi:hypothetical protein
MQIPQQHAWYHANQYTAESACVHFNGIVGHEPWCITKNSSVRYALLSAL